RNGEKTATDDRKPIAIERFGILIHLFAHQFLLMTTVMSKTECDSSSFVDRMTIPENGRFRKVEIHLEGESHVHPHKAEYADREPAALSHRAANSARPCCEITARSNPCRCSCCVPCDERGRYCRERWRRSGRQSPGGVGTRSCEKGCAS